VGHEPLIKLVRFGGNFHRGRKNDPGFHQLFYVRKKCSDCLILLCTKAIVAISAEGSESNAAVEPATV
jgi:hypothetical protein